jgi:hypothetical protein
MITTHLPGAIDTRRDADDENTRRDKGSPGHGFCLFQKVTDKKKVLR